MPDIPVESTPFNIQDLHQEELQEVSTESIIPDKPSSDKLVHMYDEIRPSQSTHTDFYFLLKEHLNILLRVTVKNVCVSSSATVPRTTYIQYKTNT